MQAWQRTVSELDATDHAAGPPPSTLPSPDQHGLPPRSASWRVDPSLMQAARPVRRVSLGAVGGAADPSAELMRLVHAAEPVILTDLQTLSGFAPAEEWSAEALRAKMGRRVVRVSVSPSGRFDGVEGGALWGLHPSAEVLVRPPETHMRLADFLTLLLHEAPEAFYVEYNAMHQYLGDPLRSMAPWPTAARSLRPLLANLWLGKGSTTSPLHYDDYENLLCQVRGEKDLLLFPPSDVALPPPS